MKCMKDEEKKRLGPLTNELKLGIGQNQGWKKDFGEKKRFYIKREVLKCLSENETGLTLEYI